MKKKKNEIQMSRGQLILLLLGVIIIMYGLVMTSAGARVLTVDQILVHFVFPSFVGCMILVVAIVLIIVGSDKRRKGV
jgi:hypothetical protein